VLLKLHISSINAPHLDCRNDVMLSWQLVCQLLTSRKPCVLSLISVFIAQDCLNALGLLLRLDVRGHHSCVDTRLTSMHNLLLDEVQWLPMHTMHNTEMQNANSGIYKFHFVQFWVPMTFCKVIIPWLGRLHGTRNGYKIYWLYGGYLVGTMWEKQAGFFKLSPSSKSCVRTLPTKGFPTLLKARSYGKVLIQFLRFPFCRVQELEMEQQMVLECVLRVRFFSA
jgi:hypothetical protein